MAITSICNAQITTTKYYSNWLLDKEVSPSLASCSVSITKYEDGSERTVRKDIKKNEIVRDETFKGEEPVGIWKYLGTLDYNFNVVYSDKPCTDSLVGIKDYFSDNKTLQYVAPKPLSGEMSLWQFIGSNLIYPPKAQRNNISGKVFITLTIKTDGSIENIFINKGVNILLDKETVRVIRKLKFNNPPMLNGQAQSICVTFPVTFSL